MAQARPRRAVKIRIWRFPQLLAAAKQLSYNYNYGPSSDARWAATFALCWINLELVADTDEPGERRSFFCVYPQPPAVATCD